MIKLFDSVKVISLSGEKEFSGTDGVSRSPMIGDKGAVVDINEEFITVEAIDDEGYTIWLADFSREEIEKLLLNQN